MFKRIFLMLAVNLLIMITLSFILNIFGIGGYLTQYGLNYPSLMIFCLVWGMGGAFISLLLSKTLVKWTMKVQILDPDNVSGSNGKLVSVVHTLAANAGLKKMPQVGIYPSEEINAFATGPSKSNSLVAVSEGLLHNMNQAEVEGVLAHEIAHIKNGDMVTMTLVQGVVNAFVMFFARIAAFAVSQALSGDDEEKSPSTMTYWLVTMVFEMIFGVLGMIVVAWVSRKREFKADSGGASLAGREKMTAALQRLKLSTGAIETANAGLASMKISGKKSKFLDLFSTHPDLDDRIAALQRTA